MSLEVFVRDHKLAPRWLELRERAKKLCASPSSGTGLACNNERRNWRFRPPTSSGRHSNSRPRARGMGMIR